MCITILHWQQAIIEIKKCYNVTVPVTLFKYLPFSAGKTAHLYRLCLENSIRESRANVGRLSVCCKNKYITIKQTQMFCYSVCYK